MPRGVTFVCPGDSVAVVADELCHRALARRSRETKLPGSRTLEYFPELGRWSADVGQPEGAVGREARIGAHRHARPSEAEVEPRALGVGGHDPQRLHSHGLELLRDLAELHDVQPTEVSVEPSEQGDEHRTLAPVLGE